MRLSNHQKAIIALIVANIIWGAAAPIYKWSFSNIEPFTLGFLRFFLAAVILFPFVRKNLHIERRDYRKLLLLSFALFLHISLLLIALKSTSSINVPIIGSAAPIFLIFSGILFLKEKTPLKKVLGGITGLLGVLIIVLIPALKNGLDGSLIGNVILIVSTVFSVINTILTKEIIVRYKPLTLVFWTFIIASFCFFPFFLYEGYSTGFLSHLGMQGIIGIVYATIFSSVICYVLYYFATKYLLVADVGVFTYLDPIVTIMIAIPLLGEIPTVEYILGSFLVFIGIYIAENRIHYHYHPLQLWKKGSTS